MHTLETLFLHAPRSKPEITDFRLNVDLKTLLDRWGTLKRLMKQLRGLDADEAPYSVRPGIAALEVTNPRDFVRLLDIDGVVAAARRLNLDLMRKGPAINWKTHSLELADQLLTPVTTEQPQPGTADPERL